jgi:hypothetical protein
LPRQQPEYEPNHRHLDERLAGLHLPLVVSAQAPIPTEPPESPLHDPPLRQDLEALGLLVLRRARESLEQDVLAPAVSGGGLDTSAQRSRKVGRES